MWHSLRRVGVLLMVPLVCSLGSNAGGLASAATSGPEKTVIRIGALLDQTGGSTTALYRAAVELGARQINEALAKSGSRLAFEIVYGDTKSSPSAGPKRGDPSDQSRGRESAGERQQRRDRGREQAQLRLRRAPPNGKSPSRASSVPRGSSTIRRWSKPTPSRKRPSATSTTGCSACFTSRTTKRRSRCKSRSRTRRGTAPFKVGILADGGHRSLAAAVTDLLPKFSAGSLHRDYLFHHPREPPRGLGEGGQQPQRQTRSGDPRHAARGGGGRVQGVSAGRVYHPDPIQQ